MKKTLLIVDIYAFLFRSYYAINPMHGNNGVNVNAVYGTIKALFSIFENVQHTNVILALDGGSRGVRHEIFPQYKANRIECPKDLIPQFDILDNFLNSMGIVNIRINGFEADDIINTYTKIAKLNNMNVVIATYDKDLMQLVCDEVCIYNQKTKSFIHHDNVVENFNVKPHQITDYLALTGDMVDNIPGVFGVGPKKASFLLSRYKNIHEIYENIDKIENESLKTFLINGKESAFLSFKLATLMLTCNVNDPHDFYIYPKFTTSLLKDNFFNLCDEYNMNSIMKNLKLEISNKGDINTLSQGSLFI